MAVVPGPRQESDDELSAMAIEELDQACAMPWPDIKAITPWGDCFTGIAPSGREVEVERRYLWAHDPEGAVAVDRGARPVGPHRGRGQGPDHPARLARSRLTGERP